MHNWLTEEYDTLSCVSCGLTIDGAPEDYVNLPTCTVNTSCAAHYLSADGAGGMTCHYCGTEGNLVTVECPVHDPCASCVNWDDESIARDVAAQWASPGTIGKALAAYATGANVAGIEIVWDAARTINHDHPSPADQAALRGMVAHVLRTRGFGND